MITRRRKKQIEKLAVETRKKLTLDRRENFKLPSYLELFDVGLKMADLSDQPIDVYVTYDVKKKKPKICIDAKQSPEQTIYSLAHEIGHLVLDWKVDITKVEIEEPKLARKESNLQNERLLATSYKRKDGYSTEELKGEKEADYFATCFLMPRKSVKFLLKWCCNPKRNLLYATELIAFYYFVEQDLALQRIKELTGKA
ncbi:ImmA/IrrE family metallo-endopeptidase [Fructobacillus sp. M2-14]|uniref:ImmA/IrrE family metallo-endopeptidase n=1 Tax=Fructobacillus broussonetiae TaxID=2713173 RepID=A0ABS5R0X8_9LACO|nr:ImmA/IrrE family metallo-endopeptidase [Fructobacillus broussonetiae]MBS9339011.1 ImmA/IrrE family metallo-endopeptidase [Fructobacillus broussonetiae]